MRALNRLDLPSTPARRTRALRRVSDCLWSWDGRGAGLDSDQCVAGVFARAATLASVPGVVGTYTAPHSMPAWGVRDDRCGLQMGTADFLHWAVAPAPQAMSGWLEIVEAGARTVADATLFAITNDAVSGARMWLDTSGTFYRLNWSDGATTRTATLTAGQPVAGDRVRFWWRLGADGALTFRQSINDAPWSVATAATLALPATWASGAVVRLNSRGDTENPASGWYRAAKLVAGAVDVDVLSALR